MNRMTGTLTLLALAIFAPMSMAQGKSDVAPDQSKKAQSANDAENVDRLLADAIKQAADRLAPALVRIETTGGLESVGGVVKGLGPTTGVIVASDGLIISSAFNFVQKPSAILVTLPSGKQEAASIIATDHARMITLLKVPATGLVAAEPASSAAVQPGQWAIALGKTLSPDRPSVSVGIISATGRIWGRALQTDAKVSPVNYGGPLVDLEGRVLGILAPLSPQATEVTAGAEWYDSGIGFAVPLDDILANLPRLRQGDMFPGLMGVTFTDRDMFAAPPSINKVAWRSPAAQAGLMKGDMIVGIDGRDIRRIAELRQRLGVKLAGDAVELTLKRGSDSVTKKLDLVARLPIYTRPFLGILLEPPPADPKEPRVVVRHVLADSPAAKASIEPGDALLRVAQADVKTRSDAERALDDNADSNNLALVLKRGDKTIDLAVALGTFPNDVPSSLPSFSAKGAGGAALTNDAFKVDTSPRTHWMLAPSGGPNGAGWGLVLWFSGRDTPGRDAVANLWRETCREHRLILAGFDLGQAGPISPNAFEAPANVLKDLIKQSYVDPARIIVHGASSSGFIAEAFAQRNRDLVRGLILFAGGRLAAGPTDPSEKLCYFALWSRQDPRGANFESLVQQLRRQKHPAASRALLFTSQPPYLAAGAIRELGRWSELLSAL